FFQKGDYENAGRLYQDYIEFYRGGKGEIAEQRDEAEYQSVLCRFYARLRPPLDQSKTKETISLADRYLQRTDPYKKYTDEICKIKKECSDDLQAYEIDIVNQYVNLGKFTAAQNRLSLMREDFLPIASDIEPVIIELEGVVAQKQGDEPTVAKKIAELAQRFP